jgi:cytochrome c nitrite reductase small subunit
VNKNGKFNMSLFQQRLLLYFLGAALILAAAGSFAAFGPPDIYAKSESPEFCGSCHVLQPEYEAWFHSGAHRRIKCVDCHLPNDNLANHLLWKGLDGVKDSVKFHTGLVSADIRLSAHGAHVVEGNCRRCHTELISRVNIDRRCWDCHRSITHKHTGTIATLTP